MRKINFNEKFLNYLSTNLFFKPTITSFLAKSNISYYIYKKNFDNDGIFLDEFASFLFEKYFLRRKNHLPFNEFIKIGTNYFCDYVSTYINALKRIKEEQYKRRLEEIKFYLTHYIKKLYKSSLIEVGYYYIDLNSFLEIYFNILEGIINTIRDSKQINKQKISQLLDIFFENLNIYSSNYDLL